MSRALLCLILLIPAIGAGYYFAFALPEHNRTIEALQRERIHQEQIAREKQAAALIEQREHQEYQRELEKSDRSFKANLNDDLRDGCFDKAAKGHDAFLKDNGTPVAGKPGVYHLSKFQSELSDKKYKDDREECLRLYPVLH